MKKQDASLLRLRSELVVEALRVLPSWMASGAHSMVQAESFLQFFFAWSEPKRAAAPDKPRQPVFPDRTEHWHTMV